MEVIRYVHKLNMTEAGLSGTKALFLRITKDANDMVVDFWGIESLRCDTDYPLLFEDQSSAKKYKLVLRKFSTNSKELRINSIVDYLKDKNIETGDEIILTRICKAPNNFKYYISVKKNTYTQFCYAKGRKLYVILHKEYTSLDPKAGSIHVTYNGKETNLSYKFVEKNTLRDAATKVEGDSTAKGLTFSLFEVKLGGGAPKNNMSLIVSNGKYLLIEEKKWEWNVINS